ncbi:hypothetical protein [Haloferax sp. DFSO52]|uniref:hypothetical protein n=1 Tax=Haloferax sp. DFSO52 TaxID=3388505 RepID=UPI003A860723
MGLSWRRILLVAIVVPSLILGGVVTVQLLDYRLNVGSSAPAETPVPADATPVEILDRGTEHLEWDSHTATVRTGLVEPGLPLATLEYRHNPRTRTRLSTLVTPNSESEEGVREWLVGVTYVHDALARASTETVSARTRPDQQSALSDPTWSEVRVSHRSQPALYTEGYRVFDEYDAREGWSVLSRNESTVVVGATNKTDYAQLSGIDPSAESTTGPCSLRVFVSVETGRITRIVEQSCFGSEHIYTETTIHDYGTTEVARPPGIGWPTLDELLTDVNRY